jgi:hypothetical protein
MILIYIELTWKKSLVYFFEELFQILPGKFEEIEEMS